MTDNDRSENGTRVLKMAPSLSELAAAVQNDFNA